MYDWSILARKLHESVETLKPGIPFVLVANKSDMTDAWVLNDAAVENVEEAFSFLVNEMNRPSAK